MSGLDELERRTLASIERMESGVNREHAMGLFYKGHWDRAHPGAPLPAGPVSAQWAADGFGVDELRWVLAVSAEARAAHRRLLASWATGEGDPWWKHLRELVELVLAIIQGGGDRMLSDLFGAGCLYVPNAPPAEVAIRIGQDGVTKDGTPFVAGDYLHQKPDGMLEVVAAADWEASHTAV